jgi:hypothetical protein
MVADAEKDDVVENVKDAVIKSGTDKQEDESQPRDRGGTTRYHAQCHDEMRPRYVGRVRFQFWREEEALSDAERPPQEQRERKHAGRSPHDIGGDIVKTFESLVKFGEVALSVDVAVGQEEQVDARHRNQEQSDEGSVQHLADWQRRFDHVVVEEPFDVCLRRNGEGTQQKD